MFDSVLAYWRGNRAAFESGLGDFLRIPSISTLSEHKPDVMRAAKFLEQELVGMGLTNVRIVEGKDDEHPIVRGEWLQAPGAPTLLLYAHYDVQPVDPLDKWISPPFEPTVRNGKLFARGAIDDKGQLYILLKVLEGFLKTNGKLPVNVKVIFEGEEESSGAHIERYVREHQEELKADAALVLDTGMFAPGMPTITTGLRGIACARITVRGANSDLHSGEHGGAAPNPLQALAEIIAKLKTPTGRVRVPGFYNGVAKPTADELDSWARLPFDEASYVKHELGAAGLIGDRRYSVLHRRWARPTLEVNGIAGGFAGDGFKTVIPSSAVANISMRLVPGQDADAVAEAFCRFVKQVAPRNVITEVENLGATPAMVVDTAHPYIRACAQAFRDTWGVDTSYVREGGSIPIAGDFKSVLGLPVLITGISLPDCNLHAPNENLDLANFHAGIEAVGRYFDIVGKMAK